MDLSESSLSDVEEEQVAIKTTTTKPIQIVPEPSYSAPLPPKSSFAMRWQSPQSSSPFEIPRSRLTVQNLSDSDIRSRMGRKVIVEEEEEEEEE